MTEYRNNNKKQSRAMLVIAHPGHELRVHGWLETSHPDVWVLTNGSGRTQHSRIDSTTRVLCAAGAVPGPVYGQMSDVDLYNDVLEFNHSRFTDLVDQLVDGLIRADVECVAGDAEEGYNPAHDICRLVINAALRLVKSKTNREITNYDFTLMDRRPLLQTNSTLIRSCYHSMMLRSRASCQQRETIQSCKLR
jgi:hypothetical protein